MSKYLVILLAAATAPAFADTINFEAQCPSGQQPTGPCSPLFSSVGNAQTLTIPTSAGNVIIQGGALFDDITALPVDETAVYGTAGNATGIGVTTGTGFTNPLTITFPVALTNFSLDVLNGNTQIVEYQLADNVGNILDLSVAANFSSGLQTMGFAATGTVITLSAITGQSTPSGMTWDYLIDNINFTTTTPEPTPAILIGLGLLAVMLAKRQWARFPTCSPPFEAASVSACGAAPCAATNSNKNPTLPGCLQSRDRRERYSTVEVFQSVAVRLRLPFLLAVLPFITPASAATPIALSCPTPTGATGIAYSSQLTATGGVPLYTISITTGALPTGLTLNATTGAITGTPAASGPFPFTAKVVDSLIVGAGGSPDSTTAQCTISIAGAPVITDLSPYEAVSGGPQFTMTVDGTGFTPTSVVQWNGTSLPTTYISTTQLTVPVTSNLITTPQYATVTVSNNGLMSNAATFSVEETWVQIFDQSAVTFGQLPPGNTNLVFDWQTGMAFADYNELSKGGYTSGYIQVLEFDSTNPDDEGAWVVQNLPIEGPQFLPGIGVPFTFAAQMPGQLAGTNSAVYHTVFAAAPPKKPAPGGAQPPANGWQPVRPAPAKGQFFPIQQVPSTIGGMYVPPIMNPPKPSDIQPIDPDMKRNDSQDSLTDTDSMPQKVNECAPAAVANSMNYLKVKDGANDLPSGKPNSRVGLLDAPTLMATTSASGTSPLNLLTGKTKYINGQNSTGTPLAIDMDSQGMFCPTPSIDPKCSAVINGQLVKGQPGASGTTIKEPFITDALQAKKDVEVCFAWAAYAPTAGPPPTPFQPGGAHCVFVTGYRFVNGYLTLDYTQDLNQGGKVPGIGWENGGHMSMRVGIVNGQLWIRSFFGRPALIMQVITEAPK